MLDKRSRLPVAIKDVVIVVAGVAIVWAVVWIWFGTNPFYVVSSGSMEPALKVNDILVVRDGQSFNDLKIGEIIVFNRPDGGDRVIVHRIVEITEDRNGDRIIRTKGDANPGSIPGTDFPITEDKYIGMVVYVIPGVGFITQAIAPPVNYIIIAIILVILFFNRMGKSKKPAHDAAAKQDVARDKPTDSDPSESQKQDPGSDSRAANEDIADDKPTDSGSNGSEKQNAASDGQTEGPGSQPSKEPTRDKNEVQD